MHRVAGGMAIVLLVSMVVITSSLVLGAGATKAQDGTPSVPWPTPPIAASQSPQPPGRLAMTTPDPDSPSRAMESAPTRHGDAMPSSSPSTSPIAVATILGRFHPHATYGLNFGRAAALVPDGAVSSGANAPGQWTVTKVYVQVGDHVDQGDVLAEADTTIADLQIESAETALDLAQAKLDKELARPTAETQAAADAKLQQAQQRLDAAKQALADTRAQTRAAIQGAKENLDLARSIRQRDARTGQPPATIAADRRAESAARAAWRNTVKLGGANDNKAAQAVDAAALALTDAQQVHATAIAPATPDIIAAGQLAVAQATQSLSAAEAARDATRIVAPTAGVVVAMSLTEGAAARPGDAILLQEGPMELTLQVPEAMMTSLVAGRHVEASIPALLQDVGGEVTRVGWIPSSAPGASVVTYPVEVTLRDPPRGLLTGMTAIVESWDD